MDFHKGRDTVLGRIKSVPTKHCEIDNVVSDMSSIIVQETGYTTSSRVPLVGRSAVMIPAFCMS